MDELRVTPAFLEADAEIQTTKKTKFHEIAGSGFTSAGRAR